MAIRLAGKRFEYILEADRASEVPSVFVIRELNHRERASVGALMPADDADAKAFDAAMTDVCTVGLIEVRNCMAADGTLATVAADAFLDGLRDPAAVTELAIAVMRLNTLSDDDKKKSDSPLPPNEQS